ncbi:MAG: RNA-binding S4 domain-containing protein [Hyphomicrobiaceae bacterium]|nr:RNA-binding S4 domain-containing protein [Hyphomicrobiaceae bacterium]
MTAPAEAPEDDAGAGTQRLDKWLWYARLAKSRTLAAGLVTDGRIRINRAKVAKPSSSVRVGDIITASVTRNVRVLKVQDLGTRRGPAAEAKNLYEELTPVVVAPHSADSVTRGNGRDHGNREPGAGRPTKRDRRLLDKLKGDGQ